MKFVILIASFLLLNLTDVCAEPTKLEGFGGYKFGMTLEEADAVRADDTITDCTYQSVYKCLTRKAIFYGHEGEINVQIDDTRRVVVQIVITFDRLEVKEAGEATLKKSNHSTRACDVPTRHLE